MESFPRKYTKKRWSILYFSCPWNFAVCCYNSASSSSSVHSVPIHETLGQLTERVECGGGGGGVTFSSAFVAKQGHPRLLLGIPNPRAVCKLIGDWICEPLVLPFYSRSSELADYYSRAATALSASSVTAPVNISPNLNDC